MAIALVFFLICAIVGSVVLTAASVNAKAVQTQRDLQQDEFTVGSAARTIGDALASSEVTVNVPVGSAVPTVDTTSLDGQDFARSFWSTYGDAVLAARAAGESFSSTDMSLGRDGDTPVFGRLTVTRDLDISVDVSLSEDFAADSPYTMNVAIQCVPSYDLSGNLTSFSYEQAVVRVTGRGVDAA